MRERGERYSDTRMLAFELRVLSLILATIVLCATRMATRARELAERVFPRGALVDTAVALQYFAALYVLSLPVEIYGAFLRPHRFGFSDQSFSGLARRRPRQLGNLYRIHVIGILGHLRIHPQASHAVGGLRGRNLPGAARDIHAASRQT